MTDEELRIEKVNTISGLHKARQELVKRKADLEDKIKDIDKTIAHLWEVFDICPRCYGVGKHFKRSCAEDDGEEVTCEMCKGNGRFNKTLSELPQYQRYMYL